MKNASVLSASPPELPLHVPTRSKNLGQLVLLGEEHSGRDEMNLAGHPFALLQAPGAGKEGKPIFYEWPRTLPDGRRVTASWHVKPGGVDGMPGPSEELLYLVLLQMTREAAERAGTPSDWPQVVHFSRGDLLQRLEWNRGERGAATLEAALSRLTAVSIAAQWAFHDARTKSPVQKVGFHILSSFAVTPEPMGRRRAESLPLSWFQWDSVLHGSLLAGNVRSLALDFTLSLQSPTARRLFRLLDMLRLAQKVPRKEIAIGAFKLRDRLGMTPYKHPSKVKEKLLAGVEELQSAGYLGEVDWGKMRDGSLLTVFRFGKINPAQVVVKGPQRAVKGEERVSADEVRRMSEMPDVDAEHAALDAAFDALPEEKQAAIDAIATSEFSSFLRERVARPGGRQLPGVRIELQRVRRREMARELAERNNEG